MRKEEKCLISLENFAEFGEEEEINR